MANKKLVRTAGFPSKFVVNKDLIITVAGVELTQAQTDKALKAAEVSKVTLMVSDTKDSAEGASTTVKPDQGEGS